MLSYDNPQEKNMLHESGNIRLTNGAKIVTKSNRRQPVAFFVFLRPVWVIDQKGLFQLSSCDYACFATHDLSLQILLSQVFVHIISNPEAKYFLSCRSWYDTASDNPT